MIITNNFASATIEEMDKFHNVYAAVNWWLRNPNTGNTNNENNVNTSGAANNNNANNTNGFCPDLTKFIIVKGKLCPWQIAKHVR